MPRAERRRGRFAEMIRRLAPETTHWVEVDARAPQLPAASEFAALVITGSAARVAERTRWMTRAEAFVLGAVEQEVPTLGICFGHQLLGQALGGRVAENPAGREMGTKRYFELSPDEVVSDSEPHYLCNMSHLDSVVELPPGARVVGHTQQEPHAAVRFGESTWGVQFHPEFDEVTMRSYIEERRDILRAESRDPEEMLDGVKATHAGSSVIPRFLSRLGR